MLIDIQIDKKAEFFEIKLRHMNEAPEALVLDINPEDRHLFLLLKDDDSSSK